MTPRFLFSLAALLAAMPLCAQRNDSPPSQLPVKQVTLFTSGVSYTERAGEVDGDASVPLLFRTAQLWSVSLHFNKPVCNKLQ